MANLIIWRHAEAEELSASGDDADRELTRRGVKDAARMARWLQQHLPENYEILSSPAQRCLQTAAALQHASHKNNAKTLIIAPYLATDGSVALMLKKLINMHSNQTIVLVGHQPQLGEFIASLLGMAATACVVKKGAVWWLRQRINDEIDIPGTAISSTAVSGSIVSATATTSLQTGRTSSWYLFAVKPPRY